MDTIPPSEGSSPSTEPAVLGPFEDHDAMYAAAGVGHPLTFEHSDALARYDGAPVVSIGTVAGDGRPRLDVLVDQRAEGGENDRVFTDVRHQLVFADEDALRATLHQGTYQTMHSYGEALEIHRYETICTRIGHPRPDHRCEWRVVALADIPAGDLPDGTLKAGDAE